MVSRRANGGERRIDLSSDNLVDRRHPGPGSQTGDIEGIAG